MHILLWIIILLATHFVAFVLGMIYKGKTVELLQAENARLRAAASGVASKITGKL